MDVFSTTTELRQTARRLARNPGFTAAAVASLALGIGATAVMFSIVNGVLLRPLAYRDSGQLYTVQMIPPPQLHVQGTWPVNARHFHEWREHCRSCESVALVDAFGMSLTGEGEPERLSGLRVSYNFFRTLGAQPAMGRDFHPEEERPGRAGEVIITDALWRSRFAADPKIIGRKLTLNGEAYDVIGVMPNSLKLPKGAEWRVGFSNPLPPAIFRPFGMNFAQAEAGGSYNYVAVVRLKSGVTPQAASAEMNGLLAQFQAPSITIRSQLVSLFDSVTGRSRRTLWLLLGAVGTLLLMMCVNVGNLMLLRTASRAREAGIRTALGSGSARLFALVFQEATALAAIGAGLGLLLANFGLQLFQKLAPVELPRLDEVRLDGRVLAFTVAATALSAILCGLLPAWRLTRIAPFVSLKAGSTGVAEGGSQFRLRELLVSVEVALSALLLIAGALLTVSFYRVMQADRGIETAHVITQDVALIHPKYARGRRTPFVAELVRRLREIPGVEAAGVTSQLPLRGEAWADDLADGAIPRAQVKNAPIAQFRFVSDGFAEAMGIKLRAGRLLRESDGPQPVAMISEGAARALWPNRNAVGRRVWGTGREVAPAIEVVGVVGDVRADAEMDSAPVVYLPFGFISPGGLTATVRTLRDPDGVTRAMRGVLRDMDPELPLTPSRTMDQILDESVAVRRFETKLVAAFAMAALLSAIVGVYGVLAFSVARRTPEMGIRLALGSPAQAIVSMVVRQGMWPVLIGLAAGVAAALALGRVIASQLYEVAPSDPVTIAMVAVVLMGAGLAASYIPARRASRTDPLQALRFE